MLKFILRALPDQTRRSVAEFEALQPCVDMGEINLLKASLQDVGIAVKINKRRLLVRVPKWAKGTAMLIHATLLADLDG